MFYCSSKIITEHPNSTSLPNFALVVVLLSCVFQSDCLPEHGENFDQRLARQLQISSFDNKPTLFITV